MEGVVDTMDVSKEREAWALAAQHFKKPVFNRTDIELSRILSLISKLKPLVGLPFEHRLAISKVVKFRIAEPGEELLSLIDKTPVAPGEFEGQQFLIIVHGCVKHTFMSVNGRLTRELFKDDTVGIPCVTASLPQTSRFAASEPTELLYLDMDQFKSLLGFLDRQEIANRIDFFKSGLVVPVLASWVDTQFEALARSVFPMRYQSRTVAVKEGEKADFVYFLTQGKMKVVREVDFTALHGEPCAKMLELATLTRGEYFGELGMLRVNVDENKHKLTGKKRADGGGRGDHEFSFAPEDCTSEDESEFDLKQLNPSLEPIPRQATVYSHTPAEVLVLPRDKFIELFQGSALVRVQEYAKGYPSQAEIRAQYHRQQRWSNFKDHVMAQVVVGTSSDTGMVSPRKASATSTSQSRKA